MSEQETFNIAAIAARLDVSEGTIRNYQKTYNIPSWKISTGERLFSGSMLAVFQQIIDLKEIKRRGGDPDIEATIADAVQAERERIQVIPETQGIDTKQIIEYVAAELRSELSENQNQLYDRIMRGILEYSVELNQSIGAYKTQVAYLTDQLDQAQSQVKLLPAQTDTLRSQIGNKDQEILELKTKIRSFELEARHDQNKIIDAEKKLKEIESNLLNQIGETAKAQAIADELKSQVESLQAENLELKSRIDAEAKKTWIDKLINKEAKK